MSINDESAARRAAENDPDLNPDGTVGVGTDGSLVSHVDRDEEATVGVGTDGSLVSEPDDHTDQAPDDRDARREPL